MPIFLLQMSVPINGHLHHSVKLVVDFLYPLVERFDVSVCLVGIEFQDAPHLYFKEFENVVTSDFSYKFGLVRVKSLIYMRDCFIDGATLFILFVFVNSLLDKYFFKRR